MSASYRELIAKLEMRKGVAEIITSVSKTASGKAVTQLAFETAPEVVQGIVEEGVKAIVGTIAGPLLKLLLGVSDKLEGRLHKLARAPFETGIRAAGQALRLTSEDPDQMRFREERLTFAINELERAWTLVGGSKTEAQDRLYIRIVQGLCSVNIRGGLPNAQVQLGECVEVLVSEIGTIDNEIQSLRADIRASQEQYKAEWKLYEMAKGTGYFASQRDSGIHDSPLANAYRLRKRIEKIEAQVEHLQTSRDEITDLVKSLQGIIGHAPSIANVTSERHA